MSRRKQANPQPLGKKLSRAAAAGSMLCRGEADSGHHMLGVEPSRGHRLASTHDQYEADYDDDEVCRLVIDTDPPNDPIESASHFHPISQSSSSAPSSQVSPVPQGKPLRSAPLPPASSLILPLVGHSPVDRKPRSRASSVSSTGAYSRSSSVDDLRSITPTSGMMGCQQHGRASLRGSAPSKSRRKSDKIQPVTPGEDQFECPVCHNVLADTTELTRHIRSHNAPTPTGTPTPTNSCTICGKVLSSQSSLDRHMLVHSGERPFQCRVCAMAFTTNGNMHRHMRIHEKELGLSPTAAPSLLKGTGGSARAHKTKQHHYDDEDDIGSQHSSVGGVSVGASLKRRQDTKDTDGPPAKRSALLEELGINTSPYKRMLDIAVHKDDPSALQCPVCDRSFLCSYGMESHLDTHTHMMARCSTCTLTFSSPKALYVHNNMVHHRQGNQGSNLDPESNTPTTKSPTIPIGFHEMEFSEFSCGKFTHIARAWCEKNQRRPSSSSHSFTCQRCNHAFPSVQALKMHAETHAPERLATCMECDCTFVSHEEYQSHKVQHHSQKILDGYAKLNGAADNELQDCVSKEEFLLVLNLAVNPKAELDMPALSPAIRPTPVVNSVQDKNAAIKNLSTGFHKVTKPGVLQRKIEQFTQKPAVLTSRPNIAEGIMGRLTQDSLLKAPQDLTAQVTQAFGMADMSPSTSPSLDLTPNKERVHLKASSLEKMECMSEALDKEGTFMCKYCEETFSNYRAWKSHERTHLGLSPYKCNLCSYSSADKSTLIRHLRTHNGERPFQCLICDFAFTTKANCERHVRKRHARAEKEEIDSAIGYNQFAQESSPETTDAFASPDTVCKYCGEDFKFFRALKHHLRSHSSCRHKPYVCRLCNNGFSTKANSVRHVQKQHPEIEQNQVEAQIDLKDFLPGYEGGENSNDGIHSPLTVQTSSMSPPPTVAPPAHSLKLLPPVTPNGLLAPWIASATHQVASLLAISPVVGSPASSCTSSRTGTPCLPPYMPSPMQLKMEPMEVDQPLDFSMKPVKKEVATADSEHDVLNLSKKLATASEATGDQDQPMDLTMSHRRPAAAIPRPAAIPAYDLGIQEPILSAMSMTTGRHSSLHMPLSVPRFAARMPVVSPCGDIGMPGVVGVSPRASSSSVSCPPEEPRSHMKLPVVVTPSPSHCPPPPANHALPLTGMLRYKKEYQKFFNPLARRLQCPYCKMLFKHGLKLLVHIRSHTNERPFPCDYCSASFTIRTNLDRHLKTRHPQFATNIPDSILSSDPEPEPAFFKTKSFPDSPKLTALDNNNSSKTCDVASAQCLYGNQSPLDSSDSDLASVTRLLDNTSSMQFSAFFRTTPDSQDSLPPSPESAVTTPKFTSVLPMLGIKSEPGSGTGKELPQHSTPTSELISPDEEDKSREDYSDEECGSGLHSAGSPSSEHSNSTPRKKRNSYADSPHKLQCPYCPRAFPWISSLKRHILTHTGQKPYKCPQCPVIFSTKSNRERHMVRKHGLDVHDPATRQMMDRPFKCHLCSFSSFSSAGNLLRHYQEKHSDKHIPESIITNLTVLQTSEDMQASLVEKIEQVASTDNLSALASINPAQPELMQLEQKSHEMEDDLESLGVHPLDASSGSESPIPSPPLNPIHLLTSTPSETSHAMETPDTHRVTETPDSAIVCEKQVPGHVNPERDNYNVDKITNCWKCGDSFSSRKVLLRHLKEHNVDLPYKCYLCDASYDSRLECLQHKRISHAVDWEMVRDKNKIKNVEEFVAAHDRIVALTLAGETVTRGMDGLLEDLKPESDYAQRKVYCSLCPKRFWSLQDLRRHMRSHTGERPFECDICQARFTLKHSMMRHRRKHCEASTGAVSGASDDDSSMITEDSGLHTPMSSMSPAMTSQLMDTTPHTVSHTPSFIPQTRRPPTATRSSGAAGRKTAAHGEEDADAGGMMLHSLLGVDSSQLDDMLNSATEAAQMLGLNQGTTA